MQFLIRFERFLMVASNSWKGRNLKVHEALRYKRTAQAALTLLVEYCGAHSQDSSVRRELPACR